MAAHHVFTSQPAKGAGHLAWEYFESKGLIFGVHFDSIEYESHQWSAVLRYRDILSIISFELRHWDWLRSQPHTGE